MGGGGGSRIDEEERRRAGRGQRERGSERASKARRFAAALFCRAAAAHTAPPPPGALPNTPHQWARERGIRARGEVNQVHMHVIASGGGDGTGEGRLRARGCERGGVPPSPLFVVAHARVRGAPGSTRARTHQQEGGAGRGRQQRDVARAGARGDAGGRARGGAGGETESHGAVVLWGGRCRSFRFEVRVSLRAEVDARAGRSE